jgi:predicted Rossmann-fold nucleotide-binding protein
LFGSDYWAGMLQWLKEVMLREGKIVEEDLRRLHLTDSPAEVVEIISRSQDSLRKLDKTVSDEYTSEIS